MKRKQFKVKSLKFKVNLGKDERPRSSGLGLGMMPPPVICGSVAMIGFEEGTWFRTRIELTGWRVRRNSDPAPFDTSATVSTG